MAQTGLEDALQALKITQEPDLRMSTILKQEAENFLKANKLEVGSTQMSLKIGEAHRGQVELVTNVHGMVMNTNVIFYRYEVTIFGVIVTKDHSELVRELSPQLSGDYQKSDRRNRARNIFSVLKTRPNDYLSGKRCLYFDLQSILYSLEQLEDHKKLLVEKAELPDERDHENFARYEVHIQKVDVGFQVTLGDLSGLSEDLALCDHSLAQLLDIATSQHAMFTPEEHVTFSTKLSFLMNPGSHGFREVDTACFNDTQSYLGIGASKSVRFIEGPSEKGRSMGVVIQTKKTPFHYESSLLEKAVAYVAPYDLNSFRECDRAKLDNFLRGLWVQTEHRQKIQRFSISKVSKVSARSQTITVGEESMTIEQYFQQNYKIELAAPTAPLVECKGRKGIVLYFPMELCCVCENQRVKIEQQTPAMTQTAIKRCSIPPLILLEQNRKTARSLNLSNNPELTLPDIKVIETPIQLKADKIPTPTIEFANQSLIEVGPKYSWMGDKEKYSVPSVCVKWAAYAFMSGHNHNNFDWKSFQEFLGMYVQKCKQRGMIIESPDDVCLFEFSYEKVQECFEKAAKRGYEFVFAVHGDLDDDAHAGIKFAEQQYNMVSQALRYGTMCNVAIKKQNLTIQNIVNKTNIKFGGLNYSLAMNTKNAKDALNTNTLYIGIGSSHPGGGFKIPSENLINKEVAEGENSFYPTPTVVGFASNVGPNGSFDFVGDFVYQQPYREEKVDVIALIVERCIEMFQQRRRSSPERVIIYRGGCSEGQFRMILEYEVPLMKYAFRAKKCESVKLTVISVNKLQEVRFFKKKIDSTHKPDEQNIQPGVVIDHTVVHPVFCEFFLNSHRALQGTARTPKYTILLDENNMKLGQVESMSYHLCYGHQIVYLPTSLPSPVYIANRYAERGRKLYQQFMMRVGHQHLDYEKLTEKLSFYSTTHHGYRVNA